MIKNISIYTTLLFMFSCTAGEDYKHQVQDPGYLHASFKMVTDIIIHDIFSPPVSSRIYAYVSVAAYEAVRHQDSSLVSLAGQLNGLEPLPQPEQNVEYCFPLASVQATLKMARILTFSENKLDAFYNITMSEYKNSGIPEDVYERSIAYGTQVADHILKWSSKDNYKQSRSFPKYSLDQSESTWKPTPPAYMDAVEPHWGKIRPFVIDSASQFRPSPPPAFSKEKKSKFFQDATLVYETGKSLTKEQEDIARFWDCNPFVMNVKGHVMFASKKISPGGHWMNIARVACVKSQADFARSAEAYVWTALSLADGFIACWEEKYRSLLIRPESYINQYIDETWAPLLQTPPFPEYISGHSVISGAASSALTGVFGDGFAYTDSTEMEFGLSIRSFTSFNAAAAEAARSRLYGGIHYLPACEIGLNMGRNIGGFIVKNLHTRKTHLATKS